MKLLNNSPLYASDLKDGDKFYVFYKNEIVAVKLADSYICKNMDTITIKGRFITPRGEWTDGAIYSGGANGYNSLYFCTSGENHPYGECTIYKTIEDARNNIPYRGKIDITTMDVIDKGVNVIPTTYGFEWSFWTYYSSKLKPCISRIDFSSFIRIGDSLKISDKNTPWKNAYWSTEEDCMNAINKRLAKATICDFEEDKKVPTKIEINVSIKVNTDATRDEIINAVLMSFNK